MGSEEGVGQPQAAGCGGADMGMPGFRGGCRPASGCRVWGGRHGLAWVQGRVFYALPAWECWKYTVIGYHFILVVY